ncbi:unnamed protein product, partial [Mesorhabditis belari]|uniref:Glycine N-acyltransferase-like protein n=1 Tax=Mesorhabditis belari TaxID=2138241 RepID=A0AAF3J603_9BILA
MIAKYSSNSRQDLLNAQEKLKKLPRLKFFLASLKIEISGILVPESKYLLFSFEDEKSTFWIGYKRLLQSTHIHVAVIGDFNQKSFETFTLDTLRDSEVLEDLLPLNDLTALGDPQGIQALKTLLGDRGIHVDSNETFLLFSFPEIIDPPEICLPHGYFVDKIREQDIPLVMDTWKYGSPSEEEQIRVRIEKLGTVCIRQNSSQLANHVGFAAGFALLEHDGSIIHLYVLPGYRGRKLRDAIFPVLAYKAQKKFGIEPFFCCLRENNIMLNWAQEEWKVLDDNGDHYAVDWLSISIDEFRKEFLSQ